MNLFNEDLPVLFNEQSKSGLSLSLFTDKLKQKQNLTPQEAYAAMRTLMQEEISDDDKAAFLTALTQKGETEEEIAVFAYALRQLAEKISLDEKINPVADTCGTGGGAVETFNISTSVAFLLAAAGVTVAKHGNRKITSQCGSADVLEALGVNINIPPEKVKECIEKIGIGFLFAPNFHKAFKNVQKVRQSLRFPTVFNILGPLVNPAFDASRKVNVHLLGARAPELTGRMANVMKLLNAKKAWVVCGYNADKTKTMDEMSICGETQVTELTEDGGIKTFTITPEEAGIQRVEEKELKGGAPQENAALIKNILLGLEKSAKQKAFLFNAGAALVVSGKAATLSEGIATAGKILRNGTAYTKVRQLVEFTNQ